MGEVGGDIGLADLEGFGGGVVGYLDEIVGFEGHVVFRYCKAE